MLRPCMDCGQLTTAFTRCGPCRRRNRPYNDAVYQTHRKLLLAGNPPCALRTHCNGAPATTADHITPLERGGTHAWNNLRPACLACNSARRNRRESSKTGRPEDPSASRES
jgi:5-methylcytosine-specific restriction endonuclease McrA